MTRVILGVGVAVLVGVRALAAGPSGDQVRDLSGEWVEQGGKKVLRLHWRAPAEAKKVDGYRILVDTEEMEWEFVAIPEKTVKGTSYDLVPKAERTHRFRVYTVMPGGESLYVEAQVLAPGRVLPPAVMRDCKPDEGAKTLTWDWKYETSPRLRGFRVYQNGKLVADEKVLNADARSWTTPALPVGKRFEYQVEAVADDGSVSERGPAKGYTFFKK